MNISKRTNRRGAEDAERQRTDVTLYEKVALCPL